MDKRMQKHMIKCVTDPRTAFFGSVLLSMEYTPCGSEITETCATDGKKLFVNENWYFKQSEDDRFFILLHEVCHKALLHNDPSRMDGRDNKLFNVACDHAVNNLLHDAGFDVPKDALCDRKYRDMPAEQIYSLLDQEQEQDQNGNSESDNSQDDQQDAKGNNSPQNSDSDGNMPAPNDVLPCPSMEDLEDVKTDVQQAVMQGEKAGTLPQSIAREIAEAMNPPKQWQELLREYMENAVSDYRDNPTYRRPNMYSQNGFLFAGSIGEELPPMAVVIDTSGSIDNKALAQFESELQQIREDLSIKQTNVLYVDTEVNRVDEFTAYDELEFHPKGGGGTDFVPAFDYIEENDLDCSLMIYFTDLECNSYPAHPDYPVIWVHWGKDNYWTSTPPFGEVVKLNK